MAKIKWGMMVTDGRGKLGGHVLSKNNAGAYVRTKVTPVNPQTSAQTAVRLFFATLSQAWSSLTAAQIAGWNNAVESFKKTDVFGDLKTITGKALFQSLNQNLLVTGQAIITDAPDPETVPTPSSFTAVAGVGATTFAITTVGDSTGSELIIRATPPLSQGTSFVKNRLRDLVVLTGANNANTDIWAAYVAKFGAPVADDNIHISIRAVNAIGQASPAQTIRATVNA